MPNVIDFTTQAPLDTEDIRRDTSASSDVHVGAVMYPPHCVGESCQRTQREIELEIEIADLREVIAAQAIELCTLKRRTG